MRREPLAVRNSSLEPARPHPRAGADGRGDEHGAHGEAQPEEEGAPEHVEQLEREEQHDEGEREGREGGGRGEEGVELGGGQAVGAGEEGGEAGGEGCGAWEEVCRG
jgi:hypothetical protein